ncbi:MAG: hypothetical protein FJ125_12860, partial [Deltaproteobacteria bacterium]|nr:hypothetical protein [Deltaproteobacteria bacterium]
MASKRQPTVAPQLSGVVPLAEHYERTRLHLRRFLAYLKPWEARSQASGAVLDKGDPGVEPISMDSHVVRLLVGSGYGEERAAALAELSRTLDLQPGIARPPGIEPPPVVAEPGLEARFAGLRQRLELSPLEVDLLWLLLVPELIPEMLWLYRSIWGDAAQVACQEDFLVHVLDPFGSCPSRVRGLLAADGKLLRLSLVEEVDVRFGRGERYFRASRRLLEFLLGLPTF